MIIIGNLRIMARGRTVVLDLNTPTGTAIFSYSELPGLIRALNDVSRGSSIVKEDLFAPLTISEQRRGLT